MQKKTQPLRSKLRLSSEVLRHLVRGGENIPVTYVDQKAPPASGDGSPGDAGAIYAPRLSCESVCPKQ